MPPPHLQVTGLLAAMADGDEGALHALLPLIYDELRSMARRQRQRRLGPDTLNTTALVHEAYLKLAQGDGAFHNRQHFFRVAAIAMRQILVDYARRRIAAKRGGGAIETPLVDSMAAAAPKAEEVLAVDAALQRLKELSPRQADVVTMRYFAGYTIPETAEMLGCSTATVWRDWAAAQAWLQQELQ